MEFGACEESLLKSQWGVTGRFHEKRDMVCIAEKNTYKGINPIAVGGGDTIAKVGRSIGRMLARDGGSFEWEVGDPVDDFPVD